MWTGANFTGVPACANGNVDFLDFLLPGLNDNVRSFRVFNVANCEVGHAEALAEASCTAQPRPDCVGSTNSALKVNDPVDTARRSVTWGWTKGSVTDLGDPVSGTTEYAICLYEGSTLKSSSVVPAGGTCADKPCWSTTSTGFHYKDASGGSSGGFKLTLRSGTGNARIGFKAGSAGWPSPLPMAADATVTVQLVKNPASGSECWSGVFAAPARKNEPDTFVDKQP